MHKQKKFWLFFLAIVIVLSFIFWTVFKKASIQKNVVSDPKENSSTETTNNPWSEKSKTVSQDFSPIGPRGNVPEDAPKDYGFWSFAISTPQVLSRSGQPTLKDFQWLKDHGWKSDINLRVDGDHNEISDDLDIPGFRALGLNYLKIQMLDGAAPTDKQAEEFLSFVTRPENQPAHVHCRGGIGRAGIMVALFRYSVEGWPMDKIMDESRLFQGGIDEAQQKWLAKWMTNHTPGSYENK